MMPGLPEPLLAQLVVEAPIDCAITQTSVLDTPSDQTPPLREVLPEPVLLEPAPSDFVPPEDASTLLSEAVGLYERGRYVEAAVFLRRDISVTGGSAPSLALLARICANFSELAEAAAWAAKALSVDKLNPELHYLYATISYEIGHDEEAIVSLKHTLYLAPDFVLAHFTLGHLLRRQGKTREARKHFINTAGLLKERAPGEVLPFSEGLAVEQLRQMVRLNLGEGDLP